MQQALLPGVGARQPVYFHADPSPVWGKLEGIGQEVEDDPFQLILVEGGEQRGNGGMETEIDIFLFCHVREGKGKLPDELYDIAFAQVERQLLFLQLPEVQQLVHHIQQSSCVTMDQLELAFPGWVIRFQDDLVHRRQYEREGRSEFMANVSEEPDLHH